MPPYLDIYVATSDRSKDCINRFLAAYADLSKDSLRNDYEIQLTDTHTWVETGSLSATIDYGLAEANRSFALYFSSSSQFVKSVMLYFSPRNRLLLGLSIEGSQSNGLPDTNAAEQILKTLKEEYNSDKGLIDFELPPADADEQIDF